MPALVPYFFLLDINNWRGLIVDIFEQVQIRINCMYISDFHHRQNDVKRCLQNMNLSDFPFAQVQDLFQYVFLKHVSSYEEAEKYVNDAEF